LGALEFQDFRDAALSWTTRAHPRLPKQFLKY
jgi:hypothetical protein